MASAENRGGDRGKLHRCAETAVGVTNESGIQHASECGQHSADDKNSKLYSANVYASGKAGAGIATHGKDAISDRCFENHQLKHDDDNQCPNYSGVNFGETTATDSVIDKLLPNGISRAKKKPKEHDI